LSTPAVLAVLAAAVLHAGWNAMAKRASNRLVLVARMGAAGAVAATPLLVAVEAPLPACWPWLAASAVVHVGYTLMLVTAYAVGDFNQTYPLARGLGPVIVAVFAAVVLDERLPIGATAGIVLVVGGAAALGLTPWRLVATSRPALAAAGLTGGAIAGYTLIDGIGVRRSGSPVGYAAWLVALQGLLTVAVVVVARRRRATSTTDPDWTIAGMAGGMAALGYGLVLWAQSRGALAAVAALRESSIVFAAIIGTVVFREPMGRLRTVASCVVAGGTVFIALFSR
jgi:drug/metabolite transporter (DMT)-like permease